MATSCMILHRTTVQILTEKFKAQNCCMKQSLMLIRNAKMIRMCAYVGP